MQNWTIEEYHLTLVLSQDTQLEFCIGLPPPDAELELSQTSSSNSYGHLRDIKKKKKSSDGLGFFALNYI